MTCSSGTGAKLVSLRKQKQRRHLKTNHRIQPAGPSPTVDSRASALFMTLAPFPQATCLYTHGFSLPPSSHAAAPSALLTCHGFWKLAQDAKHLNTAGGQPDPWVMRIHMRRGTDRFMGIKFFRLRRLGLPPSAERLP